MDERIETGILGVVSASPLLTYSLPVTLAFEKIDKSSIWYKKLIGWWTKSKYCHVEVIVNKVWISAEIDKGVHIYPLAPLNNEKYDYIKLPNAKLSRDTYRDFNRWLKKQDGKAYDMSAIFFSQVLPLRYDNTNKWICSEFVTKILQRLNYSEVADLYPQMVSPGDLANIYIKYTKEYSD